MAGGASILGHKRVLLLQLLALAMTMPPAGFAGAQSMYKYRGESGEWIYTDRPPERQDVTEVRELETGAGLSGFSVTDRYDGAAIEVIADNRFYAPVEVALAFATIEGVEFPDPDQELRWVVPARTEFVLVRLANLENPTPPRVVYQYEYLTGDPAATPDTAFNYRAPFAAGSRHAITQAYPDNATHQTPDSYFAVDIAMPVGTDVVAARDGVVFDVASKNYEGGTDARKYADLANIVRILHDDGSFSVYAHLSWDSIRVQPGDRVAAGQYIADSGDTGISSGPHLHFAVQHNTGSEIASLPVGFRGPDDSRIVPRSGNELTAYP